KVDSIGNSLEYIYDEYGRLSEFKTSYGSTNYEYDLLDRVTRVVDRNGQATVYEYDELGNRTTLTYANGVVVSYTYDACQRLKEEWVCDKDGNTIAKYEYTLGNAGERTKIEETANNETTITEYTYDKLLRLVSEKIQVDEATLTNEYTYDKVSNRSTKKVTVKGDISKLADVESDDTNIVEGTTTYEYNGLNQLIVEESSQGIITNVYDDNGNLIKQSGDKNVDYSYDEAGHLLKATIQKGNDVTIESYTYDYAGNRITKTINEEALIYYVVDTSGELAQVVAECTADKEEQAYYTRGQELLSMERDSKSYYYVYDGHGSVRALTDQAGTVTDTYEYDAYGNLLSKTGTTENDYLYVGEQYNASTGLYYLRARYMDPSMGTFISMDSYSGSNSDPITLHKYLYANANPVVYSDPTGNFSIMELQVTQTIQSTLNSMTQCATFMRILKWANVVCTVYDVAMQIRNVIIGEGTIGDLIFAIAKGVAVGILLNGMCNTVLGVVLKPVLAIFGLGDQVDLIQEAIEGGNPLEITVRFVQLVCMIFTFSSQCFTGETLVSTEEGLRPIEDIQVGDYVWSEDTETGEQSLKKVLNVIVSETDVAVHIETEENEITTTQNHPFYVEGKGWTSASELEEGDVLHTKEGVTTVVQTVEVEQLDEAVKVYNLEVEDGHTYYVTDERVLVHNDCGNKSGSKTAGNIAKNLDTNNIPNMTKQEIIDTIPDNWKHTEHNGFVHIKDEAGKMRIRIDPLDKVTQYPHVHVYDNDGNLLDILGNIVDRKSPDGHIPYKIRRGNDDTRINKGNRK
ncbi:polymorphic toxin-type HINT domain-containing protein, partial [Anaerosporobacter sp.]